MRRDSCLDTGDGEEDLVIAPVSLVSVLFGVETLSFLSSADSTDFREIIRRKMGQI